MKEINVSELNNPMTEAISKEWMLVTAGTSDKFNTMTASWGGTGYLWNKPVAFVFVRPERYTYEFLNSHERLTLAFLGEENKAVHKICGSKSGRDTDKVAEAGLRPVALADGTAVSYEQARLTLQCRKLYVQDLDPACFIDKSLAERWYGATAGGFHRMYVVEIEKVYVK